MCIRGFRLEDADTLLIPSGNYYFARKKVYLVFYCEDTIAAQFNGGYDDFYLPLINYERCLRPNPALSALTSPLIIKVRVLDQSNDEDSIVTSLVEMAA